MCRAAAKLCAKAVAAEWQKPAAKIRSGTGIRRAGRRVRRTHAQSLGGGRKTWACVLWIDEMEKGLAGIGGTGEAEWRPRVPVRCSPGWREKTSGCSCGASNNIGPNCRPIVSARAHGMKSFFVDLPTPGTRAEILRSIWAKPSRIAHPITTCPRGAASDGLAGRSWRRLVIDSLYEPILSEPDA